MRAGVCSGLIVIALAFASSVSAQQASVEPLGPSVQPVQTGAITPAAASPSVAASGLSVQRSRPECGDFTHGADGAWTAVRAIVLPAPAGPLRVEAGASFRPGQMAGGFDLGSMLQRECS